MQAQTHPLEPFFKQAVRNSYEGKLGLNDPDVTAYVAHLLCEFSESDKLYMVRDEMGRPIEELTEMVQPLTRSTVRRLRSMRNAPCASTSATMPCLSLGCTRKRWDQSPVAQAPAESWRTDPGRQGKLLHCEPVQPVRV